MDEGRPTARRLLSFAFGGLVGASAAIAALLRARRSRGPEPRSTAGLAAFEEAPCYEETVEREHTAKG